MPWIIETFGLTKYFLKPRGWLGLLTPKEFSEPAVDDVTLAVREGELFGLVGPNGAGKTTLIKLLTTLIVPTHGKAAIAGFDLAEETAIKKAIGLATSDERSFYWRLTGRQNLDFFAALYGMSSRRTSLRVSEVIEQVDLNAHAEKAFHSYSTGMRQRLSIARALLTKPRILFLDEPTKGLDPKAARKIHRLIRQHLVDQLGITILLTSHQLPEIEALCSRIAVMHRGRIQACGTMMELRELLGPVEKYRLEAKGIEPKSLAKMVSLHSGIVYRRIDDQHYQFEFDNDCNANRLGDLLDQIRASGGEIRHLSCDPISLASIFDHLTTDKPCDQVSPSADGECSRSGLSPKLKAVRPEPHVESPNPWQSEAEFNPDSLRIRKIMRSVLAFIWRDMLSETSYRFSFFMQVAEILLTVTVIFFLSRLLGQDAMGKHLQSYGGDYFSFAIIGIAFYGYFNVGISGHVNSLRDAQTTGTLEAMLSTPTSLPTIVLSSSLWSYIMTTVRVLAFLAAGKLFAQSSTVQGNYSVALIVLLLTVVSASSIGIFSASFVMVLKRGDPVTWLFRSSAFLLGGVMFPVTVLPGWMQALSWLLPTTHALKAMRLALLQGTSWLMLSTELVVLSCFCIVLLPISLLLFQYSVRRARIDGSLTHY